MRSRKLPFIALTTALCLALVGATSASARPAGPKKSGAHGPCRVLIEVPRGPVSYGDPFSIYGRLSCPTTEAEANKTISVYERTAGSSGFALAGTTTSEANGSYSFTPQPFTTNSTFFVLAEGARSAHRTIRVSPLVSLATPSEGAKLLSATGRSRSSVVFAGTVSPVTPGMRGAVVALQREDSSGNEEWHRIGDRGTVKADGTYSIAHVFRIPGVANLRIVVHPRDRFNAPAASSPMSYVISQPQNPLLTINTTNDPLTYGESTSISGDVFQAADKTPVTLFARNRNGHFAPVASGQTEGTHYSFTQAPLENTVYKVVSGTRTSSLLIEGVRYGISLTPPATTLTTGQPVTLTGTVTGAQTPHNVYLERKGPGAIGFHVIDIAPLSAPDPTTHVSTYTLTHAFRGAGEGEIRMKVPGDPGHLGKATAPVKISVTRSAASLLTPELPTKLPGEGQL
jgi:hypothetical protein